MSQEKTAEIIDLSATRAAAAGDGAGPFLASARLAAGLDIPDVAAATKIKPAHIEAIETGNMAGLPATPYAVGFVRVYAAYLGLDADAIAIEFRKEVLAARPAAAPETRGSAVPAYEASSGVKFISLFGIFVILGFAIWIALQIAGKGGADEAADAGNTQSRVRVSETRAEAPRPRPVSSARGYDVLPIPPVGSDPAAGEAADDAVAPAPLGSPLPRSNAPVQSAVIDPAPPVETPDNAAPDAAAVSADPTVVSAAETDPAISAPPIAPPLLSTIRPDAPAPDIAAASVEAPVGEQPDILPTEIAPTIVQPAAPQPVIVEARLIRSIGPKYPARCERGAGALETVSVIFDVNATGRPTNPRVTGASDDCFEDAAVAAVTKWRFNPRTVNGAPRPQQNIEATLNFRR